MANQENYVQIIPNNPQVFSVSRIAESENDQDIIVGRLPGEFGFNSDDNIEMHFYDSTNRLVGSVIVPVSTGIISAKTILLPDNQREEKVILDMTRVQKELGLLIAPGTYTVSINFFANEIGSYNDKKMIIEEVSPSRTELRLGFNKTVTDVETSELFEFVQPSVPRLVAAGFLGNAVGISQGGTNVQTSEDRRNLTDFITKITDYLLSVNPDILAQLADLKPDAVDNLDLTIEFIAAYIYDEFVSLLDATKNTKQFDRLQDSELQVILERAIDRALVNNNLNLFTQDTVLYI